MAICFDKCIKLPYDKRALCPGCSKCSHLCNGNCRPMISMRALTKPALQEIEFLPSKERLVDTRKFT